MGYVLTFNLTKAMSTKKSRAWIANYMENRLKITGESGIGRMG